ncbi:ParB family protein [Natranaerovirga pectinivora]|uniref:ParB family protein n=1 Tax=Natranaerovirga pectinivora TaxID=682400 RepID=A0A4R3MGD7_9FIRM|nr:ParB/RepB/Spo0J family partition protein [Natranaerovirga pectinivora]TCT12249.1 ParB family protein [Natranaerovirga pectinivora]
MFKNYNIKEIDINLISTNPNQPRQIFNDEMIDDLMNSIKEYGIMQPLTVRKIDNKKFELIAGERRLRASKKLGLKKVPVIINQVDNKDSAVLALVENIQRENLNFIEEAYAYKRLIEEFNYTQQELAISMGKSQSTIANKLRILKLDKGIIQEINNNNLTERHARALLKLKDESNQVIAIKEILENDLNVKSTEEFISNLLEGHNNTKSDDSQINNTEINNKTKDKKVTVKNSLKDLRVINNTISQTVDVLKSLGLDVTYNTKETDNTYQINIVIPIKN